MTVPDKLYVNIYRALVGNLVGYAYRTRAHADANAGGDRIECVSNLARNSVEFCLIGR